MRRCRGFVDVEVLLDTLTTNEQELLRIVLEDRTRQDATAAPAEAAAVDEPLETDPAASTA
jgi:hypothetical protein